MNERIKELAKEAIANVRFWDAEKEVFDVGHDELKKFAELIVRECARLPFKDTGEVTTDGEIAVSEFILKNFGVTE